MYNYFESTEEVFVFFKNIGEKISLLTFFLKESKEVYDKRCNSNLEELMKRKKKEENEVLKKYNDMIRDGEESSIAAYVSGLDAFENFYGMSEVEEKDDCFFLTDTLCKSSLINIYGLVEFALKNTCDLLRKRYGYRIEQKHFGKSYDYIGSSKDYLDLVCELDLGSLQSYFAELKDLQLIRNRLVHSLGTVEDDNHKDLLKIIKSRQKEGISFNRESNQIEILDIRFALNYLDVVRNFFSRLSFIVEKKNNFLNLKESINNILNRTSATLISSEITSSKILKLKYTANIEMQGERTDITIYFSAQEKREFHLCPQSESKDLSDEIEKMEIQLREAVSPYLSLSTYRIGIKAYI